VNEDDGFVYYDIDVWTYCFWSRSTTKKMWENVWKEWARCNYILWPWPNLLSRIGTMLPSWHNSLICHRVVTRFTCNAIISINTTLCPLQVGLFINGKFKVHKKRKAWMWVNETWILPVHLVISCVHCQVIVTPTHPQIMAQHKLKKRCKIWVNREYYTVYPGDFLYPCLQILFMYFWKREIRT